MRTSFMPCSFPCRPNRPAWHEERACCYFLLQ
nr:MAG TPA: Protein of unknown function (DUF483) [Caudoviricetes sp.]